MIYLSKRVLDGSTAVITVTFKDDDGTPITPNSVYWSMFDRSGNIINGRSKVEATPDTQIEILLYGDDLVLDWDNRGNTRFVKIWGTFDSDLGSDLPYVDEVAFKISDIHEFQ